MSALDRTACLLAAILSLGIAAPVHSQIAAIQNIAGGQPTSSVANATYGWRFRLDSSIVVTHLGLLDALSSGFLEEHRVGIWNSSAGLVAEITFPAGEPGVFENGFRYLPAHAPFTLQAGQSYAIGSWNLGASDNAVTSAHSSTEYALGIEYLGAGFATEGFTAPQNDISLAHGYFGPDFKFQLVPVPEPGEWAFMAALSLLVFGMFRRWFPRRCHA